ncbi:MAG: helix-turn-helix transcriptional regulator [Bdellovibrionales bacterium]|nr:helix-turn-helix transcriptional regulator [Bdellovibrionales bacterium]
MTSKIKKLKRNPRIVRESLGVFIKKMRLQRGYSQAELATNLGYMSPQFISDWERGISSPPVKKLTELADLLDVKVDIIFELLVTLATEQLVENLSNEFKLAKKSS